LVKKVKTEDIAKMDVPPEWDIPKGGVKDKEGDEEALWRELREEVGSDDFRLVRKLPFRMDFPLPSGSRWEKQETTLFFLEYEGTHRKFKPQTEEIAEAKLVPLGEIRELVRYETTLEAIEETKKMGLL
jgi:putative (di)nucleoside polyphosphate hydrolase